MTVHPQFGKDTRRKLLPLLIFAPARSRGTAFIGALKSSDNVILYEPLNPKVRSKLRPEVLEAQAAALGHPKGFGYFNDLWTVGAGDFFPPSLRTIWRQGSFSTEQRASVETYIRRLASAVADRGGRPVFKFEHPMLFHIASSVFREGLTIGLSRPSSDRLASYWRQVVEVDNHYFFHRDFAWRLTHATLRHGSWASLVEELKDPILLYNQSFLALDAVCQSALASCQIVVDANSGQMTSRGGDTLDEARPDEVRAQLEKASASLQAQVSSRARADLATMTTAPPRVRALRNYGRLTATVARAFIDLGGSSGTLASSPIKSP